VAAFTLVGAVIASAATFAFERHRDRDTARRATRISYLLDAYRSLEGSANRELTPHRARALEAAIADIQLLGTAQQADQAAAFAQAFAESGKGDLDSLLDSLRQSLRQELQLGAPLSKRVVLRVDTSEP
jgi:hypothetical protein